MPKKEVFKLKKEYEGKVVVRVLPKMGEIKMDTSELSEDQYEQYAKGEFADCFEVVGQGSATKAEIEEEKLRAAEEAAQEDDGEEDEFGLGELDEDGEEDQDEDEPDEPSEEADQAKAEADSEAAMDEYVDMPWPELKEKARLAGMEITGRTKKDAVIAFMMNA